MKRLAQASEPRDCLELLAESRRTLGFDAVAFRNFSGEPIYLHLADWRQWGSDFGWPSDFLDRFGDIEDFGFQPDTPRGAPSIMRWDLRANGGPNSDVGQTQNTLSSELLRQNLDSGVTILMRRPFGQLGSVHWIRGSREISEKSAQKEFGQLDRFGKLFFKVMDETGAWRKFSTLTSKELQCLQFAGRGYSDKAIAQAIRRSADTVRFHLKNVNKKLGSANRTQAVATALTHNLIDVHN
jgi:DNA-binding CsgD family transcriptional regulator